MRSPALAALTLLLAASLARAGTVEVAFDQVARYADAGRGTEAEAHRTLIAEHLRRLGETGLPARQTLRITITDIDLAGETRPQWRTAPDVRVLRGTADWPRIGLRYTLSEDDRVLREGQDEVSDMDYLRGSTRLDNAPLPYERRMLERWFRERFGPAPAH